MRNPQEARRNEWQSFGKLAKLVSSFKGCRDYGNFKLQAMQLYSRHAYQNIGVQKGSKRICMRAHVDPSGNPFEIPFDIPGGIPKAPGGRNVLQRCLPCISLVRSLACFGALAIISFCNFKEH